MLQLAVSEAEEPESRISDPTFLLGGLSLRPLSNAHFSFNLVALSIHQLLEK
jgi:hypothetical protein